MRKRSLLLMAFLIAVPAGSLLWAQERTQVGVIISDASRSERMVRVRLDKPVTEGRAVLLESRDGSVREEYQVQHIYEFHILLDRPLKNNYLSGSRIFQ